MIVGVLGVIAMAAVSSMGNSCAPADPGTGVGALGAPLLLASGSIGGIGVLFIEHTGKRRRSSREEGAADDHDGDVDEQRR